MYQQNKTKLSAFDLMKQLTDYKKQDDVKWLNEVNSQSLQQSIRNVESAFTRFFREKKGFPNFKKKHGKQSCKFTASVQIDFENKKIKLPNISHNKSPTFSVKQFSYKTITYKMS